MKTLIIFFFVITSSVINCEICDEKQPNVALTDRRYNGYYYYDGEYYVDNATGAEKGCVCMKEACARKCCDFGKAYDVINKKCFDYAPTPQFNVSLNFLIGNGTCVGGEHFKLALKFISDFINLDEYGYLYAGDNPEYIYANDKYCIDTVFLGADDKNPLIDAVVCYEAKKDYPYNYALISTCMLISCFFIILTVAVYLLVPELRNLHGMVLIAHLLSFFVGFLPLATLQIMAGKAPPLMCKITAYIMYYAFLAAFFWLNVTCYDIWWTFSGKRSLSTTRSPRKRFFWYCVYAFGVPALLTILLATLEFADLGKPSIWRPNLKFHCFLKGKSALLYLYLPETITIIANIIFFTLTALKILSIRKLTTDMQKSVKDQQRFTLYIKLFAVMGITWILEIISAFYPEGNDFWQFTDAYNDLVGLWTFIIFVCKKKTFRLIKKRLNQLTGSSSDVTPKTSRTLPMQSQDELNTISVKTK